MNDNNINNENDKKKEKTSKVIFNSKTYYIVYSIIAVILLALALISKQPWNYEAAHTKLQYLSDTFLIPGVLVIGFFLVQLIDFWGGFDGLKWSFGRAVSRLLPIGAIRKDVSFYDYKSNKIATRKSVHIEGLFIGAGLLFIAIVLYFAYVIVLRANMM